MKGVFFFFSLIPLLSWSAPQQLEVWFLSVSKTGYLEKILNDKPKFSKLYSENDSLICERIGDYCFDPQVGLYKKEGDKFDFDAATEVSFDEGKLPQIPTAASLDRSLIDCDPNYKFDLFCGKAKPEATASKAKIEIWIDTSSSMRDVDVSDDKGNCARKSFIKNLDEKCAFGSKLSVSQFDISIKETGSMDTLCMNSGLNDQKRMMDWIERSEAKKLIIITDVYELFKDFTDFIEKKHGKVRGDSSSLTAKQLDEMVAELAKSCQ